MYVLNMDCTISLSIKSSPVKCWNIRSQDYSFPGIFVPMMELSFSGPIVPWNFRSRDCLSRELLFPRTNKPCTADLSLRGPFNIVLHYLIQIRQSIFVFKMITLRTQLTFYCYDLTFYFIFISNVGFFLLLRTSFRRSTSFICH